MMNFDIYANMSLVWDIAEISFYGSSFLFDLFLISLNSTRSVWDFREISFGILFFSNKDILSVHD